MMMFHLRLIEVMHFFFAKEDEGESDQIIICMCTCGIIDLVIVRAPIGSSIMQMWSRSSHRVKFGAWYPWAIETTTLSELGLVAETCPGTGSVSWPATDSM